MCSVLYMSIHRGDIFPAGDLSSVNKVGVGRGAGFNINIPWTKVLFVCFILLHLLMYLFTASNNSYHCLCHCYQLTGFGFNFTLMHLL